MYVARLLIRKSVERTFKYNEVYQTRLARQQIRVADILEGVYYRDLLIYLKLLCPKRLYQVRENGGGLT